MDMSVREDNVTGGDGIDTVAVSPGRDSYVRQVAPDRHQATVSNVDRCSGGLRMTTWNVRSLYREGSVHNVMREMTRMNIDILGLSEVRWPGVGKVE